MSKGQLMLVEVMIQKLQMNSILYWAVAVYLQDSGLTLKHKGSDTSLNEDDSRLSDINMLLCKRVCGHCTYVLQLICSSPSLLWVSQGRLHRQAASEFLFIYFFPFPEAPSSPFSLSLPFHIASHFLILFTRSCWPITSSRCQPTTTALSFKSY